MLKSGKKIIKKCVLCIIIIVFSRAFLTSGNNLDRTCRIYILCNRKVIESDYYTCFKFFMIFNLLLLHNVYPKLFCNVEMHKIETIFSSSLGTPT